MTVYVRRNGVLVDKQTGEPIVQRALALKGFPTPRLSRLDAYESPITGKEIGSWRQRDAEMKEHDCYDPRDLGAGHVFKRGRAVQLEEVRANDTGRTDHPDDTGTG